MQIGLGGLKKTQVSQAQKFSSSRSTNSFLNANKKYINIHNPKDQ